MVSFTCSRAVTAVTLVALAALLVSPALAWWPFSKSSHPKTASAAPTHTTNSDGQLMMAWRTKPPPGSTYHKGIDPADFKCQLDPKVTAATITDFREEIGQMWGDACGRNRGIFVLNPPDGKTYDCGHLPASWGITAVAELLTLPGAKAVSALGDYFAAVYNTSIVKGPSACDFNALSQLTCGREYPWKTAPWYNKLKAPIRAVNIGGLFVLEQWILPGFTDWGEDSGIIDQHSFSLACHKLGTCNRLKLHWKSWYSPADFKEMKSYGLNTIRLPVGYWYFAAKAGIDPDPYIVPDEDLYDAHHPITNVLRWAQDNGLHVIFDLHGAPGSQNGLDNSGQTSENPSVDVWGENWLYSPSYIEQTVSILKTMTEYLQYIKKNYGIDNTILLQLVNEPWVTLDMSMVRDFYILAIGAVREINPDLPILLHDSFHGDQWKSLLKYFPYDNIYMDTHLYHGFNVADIASDNYQADKLKMYVHERMACAMTSMLRFETCTSAPTMVGEWSLAIDNCMDALDRKFSDYGQCGRIKMRKIDPWWKEHIKSFAHRQMDVYERELGWSFWTWKLSPVAEQTAEEADLWSYRMAVQAGYIDTTYPPNACQHSPKADYMGGMVAESAEPPASVAREEEEQEKKTVPLEKAASPVEPHQPDIHTSSLPSAVSSSSSSSFLTWFMATSMLALAAAAITVYHRRSQYSRLGDEDDSSPASLIGDSWRRATPMTTLPSSSAAITTQV